MTSKQTLNFGAAIIPKLFFFPIDDASCQGGRGYKIIKTDKEEDLIEIKKKNSHAGTDPEVLQNITEESSIIYTRK